MSRTGTHVIVVGNEKGGSGKSTTAVHLAIYLLYQGFRVASIDVDSRQQTFTNYIRNRRQWCQARGLSLPHTTHFHLPQTRADSIKENQRREFDLFRQAVVEVEGHADYLIVDTPGFDTHLARLAHSLADTLVPPLNDSVVDLDVIARFDPVTGEPREISHYSRLVQKARNERLSIDGKTIDWVLVRNRISMLSSRNMRLVQNGLEKLSVRLGCRVAEGIAERVIFRSLFPTGMTVFDPIDESVLGGLLSMSHVTAREEYRQLVEALHLPVSARATARRAAAIEAASGAEHHSAFVHMAPQAYGPPHPGRTGGLMESHQ
ncbi:ATPase [Arsenicitalea aurantiaca]|uniref:ATPase n=1 Tax=Arsenicitalea aurantiaca TaxID=1783274 RepID=A0A433XFW3_9HYPH|nr:division plane positioning ATPase MipZ [Arsenicitalea aurantiaca]RUT32956.1 ATPase [Arsenicitalea aurantiaca]